MEIFPGAKDGLRDETAENCLAVHILKSSFESSVMFSALKLLPSFLICY